MIVLFKHILSILIIMTICIISLTGCANMAIDNQTDKHTLITSAYTITEINEFQQKAELKKITFSNFAKEFDIQCVRKTHQGYYVVLLLEDGSNAYVFFDEGNTFVDLIVVGEFKSISDFAELAEKHATISEIRAFDPNTILMPISAVSTTVHIVKEGLCIVKYSRLINNRLIEVPIIDSIDLIANIDIPTNGLCIDFSIPYILELDKNG